MTDEEVAKVGHGLYIIHWKESHGGGTSVAAVGTDRSGRRWFAATNWTVVPSFDWSRIERVERTAGAVAIQEEAKKQLALYPPVDYTPHWHPYYWQGQRDAAKRIALEAK